VGTQHIAGGTIDFQTPYARIQGSGDGTMDLYQFEVTDQMIDPPALGGLSSPDLDNTPYFKSASLLLNGPVTPGDVWTINLRSQNYSYIVAPERRR